MINDLEVPKSEIKVRIASIRDLGFVLKYYDLLEEEEIKRVILSGYLLIGEVEEKPVGFIGEHLEGRMGLLYILPEFRKKGMQRSWNSIR